MELVQSNRSFDGEQRIYRFNSISLQGESKFGIYLPAQALAGQACPTLFYLAGLTCTEETFAIKAHAQRLAAQLGLILVTPDTSPRGEQVAQGDHWDIGQGAGFYINATQAPWAEHFQMESYVVEELYDLVIQQFAVQAERIGIFGHSMGGHGALTLALKYPEKCKSVSAFAPIAAPMDCKWGQKGFKEYLGNDTDNQRSHWAAHDASKLIAKKGKLFADILVDQGLADQFLDQLHTDQLEQVCQQAGQPLTLRRHDGYDHGYYFIQSFIDDHLQFHAVQLEA